MPRIYIWFFAHGLFLVVPRIEPMFKHSRQVVLFFQVINFIALIRFKISLFICYLHFSSVNCLFISFVHFELNIYCIDL